MYVPGSPPASDGVQTEFAASEARGRTAEIVNHSDRAQGAVTLSIGRYADILRVDMRPEQGAVTMCDHLYLVSARRETGASKGLVYAADDRFSSAADEGLGLVVHLQNARDPRGSINRVGLVDIMDLARPEVRLVRAGTIVEPSIIRSAQEAIDNVIGTGGQTGSGHPVSGRILPLSSSSAAG